MHPRAILLSLRPRPNTSLFMRPLLSNSTTTYLPSQTRLYAAAHANKQPSRGDTRPLKGKPRKSHDTHRKPKPSKPAPRPRSAFTPPTSPIQRPTPFHAEGPKGLNPLPPSVPIQQAISSTEPYFVHRTPTRNLPVYQTTKNGGNLRQTLVRKISGEGKELKAQLEGFLSPKPEWVRVNPVTGGVEMKGFYRAQILRFLDAKGF